MDIVCVCVCVCVSAVSRNKTTANIVKSQRIYSIFYSKHSLSLN